MNIAPRIQLVAFEDRLQGFVFVAVPDERGRYLRTDRSVVLVACDHCRAVKGEPCKGRQGYGGGTHVARRVAAGRYRGEPVDDIVQPVEVPTVTLHLRAGPAIDLIEPRLM
jgi:hypothetical protein